jgi:hypothetical protein
MRVGRVEVWGPRESARIGSLGVGLNRTPSSDAGAGIAVRLEVQALVRGSDAWLGESRSPAPVSPPAALGGAARSTGRSCTSMVLPPLLSNRPLHQTTAGKGARTSARSAFRGRASCANIAVLPSPLNGSIVGRTAQRHDEACPWIH